MALRVPLAKNIGERINFLGEFGHVYDSSHQVIFNLIRLFNFRQLNVFVGTHVLNVGDSCSPALGNGLETLVYLVLNLFTKQLEVEEDDDGFFESPFISLLKTFVELLLGQINQLLPNVLNFHFNLIDGLEILEVA